MCAALRREPFDRRHHDFTSLGTTLHVAIATALILIAFVGTAGAAIGQLEQAAAAFDAGEWQAAADAYRDLTRRDASNGAAWLGLGRSLHRLGSFADAITALEEADALGTSPARTRYNLARSNARLGRVNVAFTWLDRAIEAGFRALQILKTDADLEGLREDPRFAAAVERVERIALPCRHELQYRAFDFWVGDWEVRAPDGQIAGTNRIEKTVDGCLLLESWTSAGGGTGKSINFYDPATEHWVQTWVDSGGGVISGEGGLENGAMRLVGTHILKSGERRPFRMTFTPLPNGHVRQFLEESTDGGKSWSVWFDGDYAPRK